MIIHRLDSLTIDKIAAGEVIESPSACVKELVDNALDAGARDICVEIQLGGCESILVRDDGIGMRYDDLLISCERHTTSKIRTIHDLDQISSRGFRGEALSSLASVSKLTIRSREKTPEPIGKGAEMAIEGGQLLHIQEVTAPHGTQVAARSLFYNVSARRKFMKSPSKNGLEVLKTLKQLALISPHVSFTLIADKKTVFHVRAVETFLERIRDVFPDPYKNASLPVSLENGGFSIEGLLALPECAKRNRGNQYIFINKRPINSSFISYTVKSAYSSSLQTDEFPQFVLSLTVPGESLDVNVHPQKKEVRFADEDRVRSLVYEAVGLALFSSPATNQSNNYFASLGEMSKHIQPQEQPSGSFFDTDSLPVNRYEPIHQEIALPFVWNAQQEQVPTPFVQHLRLGRFSFVTLASQNRVLIDLVQAYHATLSHHIQTSKSAHMLLQPEPMDIEPLEMACIEEKLTSFRSLGFILSRFGAHTLLIEGIPSCMNVSEAVACLRDLIHEELVGEKLHSDVAVQRIVHTCTRRNSKLNEENIDDELARRILTHWIDSGSPSCTPRGKKVCISLDSNILEQLFHKVAT